MRSNLSLIAWLSIGVAFVAWAGVIMFAFSIQDAAQSARAQQGDAQNASYKEALALKIHTIARETSSDRFRLETIMQNDPLSITGMIAQAGTDAGVSLHVSDAISEGTAASTNGTHSTAAQASGAQAPAIGFTVEGDGPFAALVRAAAFLESLPVPSRMEGLDIGHPKDNAGMPASSWHMSAHLRILTSSNISS